MLKKLAALAGAVGTTVVGPMAIDTWQATRSGVARLLGRGEPARQAGIVASARDWRTAVGHVMRGLGQSVPGWRVCMGLLLLALVPGWSGSPRTCLTCTTPTSRSTCGSSTRWS